MEEIFKDIVGYEGKYMVSNKGRVISLDYQNTKTKKVLTPVKHHSGYLFVHLGKDKIRLVHVLVAKAFIPNPLQKACVNHIDGDKSNNCVENLEWVTHKENMEHAIRTGLRDPRKNNAHSGGMNHNSKPIYQYSKDGELIRRWDCVSDAARYFGCRPGTISNNATGRIKSVCGFVWKYTA